MTEVDLDGFGVGVRFDVPVMVGASVLLVVLGLAGRLGRFDGIVLFGLLIAYLVVLVRKSRRETTEGTADFEAEYSETRPGPRSMGPDRGRSGDAGGRVEPVT